MGKKGKSKGGNSATPSVVPPVVETPAPPPAPAPVKVEPVIEKVVEEVKKQVTIVEPTKPVENPQPTGGANNDENGTLKSKKNKNKKQKSEDENQKVEKVEPVESKPATIVKVEEKNVIEKSENEHENEDEGDANGSDTLKKKKRRRNKKKSKVNEGDDENEKETIENAANQKTEGKVEEAENNGAESGTLKKKKRNRHKKKNAGKTEEDDENADEKVVEVVQTKVEAPKVQATPQPLPTPPKPTPAAATAGESSRKSKNKKRGGGESKRTILDELQEKQEREQNEARSFLKNEISKREKLLEKIDMVLDCHQSAADVAKNQQESLKDISSLATNVAAQPVSEPLVNKIDQVLGATKKEIINVHQQQQFVGKLENELNRLKMSKEKYLKGETSQKDDSLPDSIKNMTKKITDINQVKGRNKEELINEIQSRDVLMAEIGKVLDSTKTEIEKVKKQQKIITNLEGELQKMKEQEITEKLTQMGLNMDQFEDEEEEIVPEQPKPSATSASLLDALMANVGKLKEIHAQKQQEKEKEKVEEQPKVVEATTKKESPKQNQKNNKKTEKSKQQPEKVEDVKKVETPKKPEEKVVAAAIVPPPKVEEIKKVEEPKKVDEPSKKVNDDKKSAVATSTIEVEKQKTIELPKETTESKISEVKIDENKKEASASPKNNKKQENQKKNQQKQQQQPPKAVEKVQEEVKKVEEPPKPVETPAPKVEEIKPQTPPSKPKENVKKESPKSSPKGNNKNQKGKKGNNGPAPVDLEENSNQKPSIADMLKNAKEAEPLVEEVKTPEKAPIATVDDDDDDEMMFEIDLIPITGDPTPKPAAVEEKKVEVEKPKKVEAEKPKEEVKKVEEEIALIETEVTKIDGEKLDESIVLVEKAEEKGKKENVGKNNNEGKKSNSKNAEGSGFASPVKNQKDQDVKPLGKDEKKATPGKSTSPVKPVKPATRTATSRSPTKPAVPPKPKNLPSKPSADKKLPPLKTDGPKEIESPQATTPATPQSPSAEKPKIPPKPESLKSAAKPTSSSPARPIQKTPTVTPTVAKSKTPSPVKQPTVTKTIVTPPTPTTPTTPTSPTVQPPVTKQKPAVPPRPANIKQPANKSKPTTNQKSAPKTNATKSPANKPAATFVFRQLRMEVSNLDSQSAFSHEKSNEKSENPQPPKNILSPMKAMLTTDGSIKIIVTESETEESSSSADESSKETSMSQDSGVNVTSHKTFISSTTSQEEVTTTSENTTKLHEDDDDDNEDEFSQYKQSPRAVFLSTACHVCKVNLSCYLLCQGCKMVAYCKEDHMKIDYLNHKALCLAIQLIAKRRGGHVYHMSKHLSSSELRNLKAYTIFICEQFLNRNLMQFERELFIFPRLCQEATCREWKPSLLVDCTKCGQVSHCTSHPLAESHSRFCESFALLQRIILRQKAYGRIELSLPHKVLRKSPILSTNVDDTLRLLYKNITAFKDDCVKAALSQISTCPLTAFYAQQIVGLNLNEQMVIHLVGAEMQFEGLTLNKWESFFLHLLPEVSDIQIVFIGPELNTDNLPIEIISRTRMCRSCRQNCRCVRFDFQCSKFYHDYCKSSSYTQPDLVCFFNPAISRPGFRGFDTWPKTIKAAVQTNAPVLVTACTENDAYLDLERFEKVTSNEIEVLEMPQLNPYMSTRPERNIASDDDVPIIFRNQFYFIVRNPKDLIEL